jgi:hypothetical protein
MFHIVSETLVTRGKVYKSMIAVAVTFVVNLVAYFVVKRLKNSLGQYYSNIITLTITIMAVETSSIVDNNMEFVIIFLPLIHYV